MRVTVRWFDGYVEVFENVKEWRVGAGLLWIKQKKTGDDVHLGRHIPLSQVRWFSPFPSDRIVVENLVKQADGSAV